MNLVIDIGNTAVKMGLFEDERIIESAGFQAGEDFKLDGLLKGRKVKKGIVSSVNKELDWVIEIFKKEVPGLLIYPGSLRLPVRSAYKTPETLGADRIPPVIGAWKQQGIPDGVHAKPILVVDAGTCIKFNFLSEKSIFMGGSISPGLGMRFKALHTFTSALPLTEADQNYDKLMGQDTQESIRSGVQSGAVAEVDGMIAAYEKAYPGLEVWLTGGDSVFFGKRLKNRIFVDPELVLKGLNCILNFND